MLKNYIMCIIFFYYSGQILSFLVPLFYGKIFMISFVSKSFCFYAPVTQNLQHISLMLKANKTCLFLFKL